MPRYDIGIIVDPDLSEEELSALEERVVGWIEAADGKVEETDRWGRRKLAYPIQDNPEGTYTFFQAILPSQAVKSIEGELRINEQIMRFLITVVEPA